MVRHGHADEAVAKCRERVVEQLLGADLLSRRLVAEGDHQRQSTVHSMATQILIPLKHLDAAKRRMHPQIGAEGRRSIMLAMLAHVAAEAVAAGLGPVALASSEPRAPTIASEHGIGLVDDGGLPWNQGLVHALELLPAAPDAVLFLAGDLPLVTADEIQQLAA